MSLSWDRGDLMKPAVVVVARWARGSKMEKERWFNGCAVVVIKMRRQKNDGKHKEKKKGVNKKHKQKLKAH